VSGDISSADEEKDTSTSIYSRLAIESDSSSSSSKYIYYTTTIFHTMIGAIRQQCSRVGTLGSRAMSSGSISLAEEIKEMKKWKVR
jgi:hypothetical protein